MQSKMDQLVKWKEFRDYLGTIEDDFVKFDKTMKYWQNAPFSKFVINWNDKFPTPWEVINEGYYDSILIAFMIKQTLVFSGVKEDRIKLCYSRNADFEGMIVVIDNKHLINYSHDEILDYENYKNNFTFLRIDDKIL